MNTTLLLEVLVTSILFWNLAFFIWNLYKLRTVLINKNQIRNLLLAKENQAQLIGRLYDFSSAYHPKEARIIRLLDDLEYNLNWKMLAYLEFLENEQALIFRVTRGVPKKYMDFVHEVYHDRIDVGSVAGGRAIATKQPMVVNNWAEDPHMTHISFMGAFGHIVSFANFPIIGNLKTYGSLHVYSDQVGRFKLNEVQFFTTVANSLAAILEHDEFLIQRRDS